MSVNNCNSNGNVVVQVDGPNVQYSKDFIESTIEYPINYATKKDNIISVKPTITKLRIRTKKTVPKTGLMMVGLGGNNATTLTAGILANKYGYTWETTTGVKTPNWFGSISQSSTLRIGMDATGKDVYVPLKSLVPMINPNDLEIDGWDISSLDLGQAMQRAQVLDVDLQKKLMKHMSEIKPRPSIYVPDFIAANQSERADNIIKGNNKSGAVDQIRADIRDFKEKKGLDQVIVLWTANTERFSDEETGLNDTSENLMRSICKNASEISPSTLFAVASILEGSTYINGSPSNTFVKGVIELAEQYDVHIAGDDFKSGQTKLKSVLVDFLVGAGIKPVSIVSYNHLGNNDGYNLSAPQQFRSKEISKSNVVDDIVQSNNILYKPNEKPDHCVVIKYVPYVGDSKRAMDEYTSEIFLNGKNTMIIHNTCEDSLLASPIILDLVVLADVFSRIEVGSDSSDYTPLYPVLSVLSYMLKAPIVPKGAPIVNSLFRQKTCIENILRACLGLPAESNMLLEYMLPANVFVNPKNDNHTNSTYPKFQH
ncbi:inositol-3-phosphate synthase-like [Adelges cooleyi]|uniref:inositol-3-phosphate synthase-like n=1 Tax=Adelges cooleyi TaxID=133065 RepID=UPI002180446A|nr:inositol-3-phosphate synthase-like [Adelges cooleyi]